MLNMQSEDNIQLYMQEAAAYPLLTAEQECELSRKASDGDMEAAHLLINSNLRLVISIAKKYSGIDVPLADRIQDGNLGLMTAVDSFDPDVGCRFATYATYWIRQSIGRAADNCSRTIRYPAYITERLSKMKPIQDEYQEKYQRQPTPEELAARMNLSVKQIRVLLAHTAGIISLDDTVKNTKEASGTTVSALIADTEAADPVTISENNACKDAVWAALQVLPDRTREIIIMRFGLDGNTPMTLDEIGAAYSLSRERVRQIVNDGIKKIRHSSAASSLLDYAS